MVCVSATLPHEVLEMTSKFMTDPIRVLVKRDELTLEVPTALPIPALPMCCSQPPRSDTRQPAAGCELLGWTEASP